MILGAFLGGRIASDGRGLLTSHGILLSQRLPQFQGGWSWCAPLFALIAWSCGVSAINDTYGIEIPMRSCVNFLGEALLLEKWRQQKITDEAEKHFAGLDHESCSAVDG